MPQGTVKWFDATRGYGFITDDASGKDIFVHISAIESANIQACDAGMRFDFSITDNKGKSTATNLQALD